ncbi:MAG: diguanylate cyclase domain-containing protein, partial [Culicoidibacterales bacterium]
SNQLNVMKYRLDLEHNPVRKHFTTYLQAIICFHQQNYVQANLLFAQIDVTNLPNQSQYFVEIYQTLSDFLVHEDKFHLAIEKLKEILPDEYYAYFLTKSVVLLHRKKSHRPQSFYLRLQLSRILPHLQPSLFIAHLYYELGQFYLFSLPNTQVAHQCFTKVEEILKINPNKAFTIMTQFSLAYATSLRPNSKQTLHIYETIDWNQPIMKSIDPFHYFTALLNAVEFFILNNQLRKSQNLLPILAKISNVSDPQKKASLYFKGSCVQLKLQLANGDNFSNAYADIILNCEKLLEKLTADLLFNFYKLQWIQLLAKVHFVCGEYPQALENLKIALELSLLEQHTDSQIHIHQLFSQTYAAMDEFELAIAHFEAADQLKTDFHQVQRNHTRITLNGHQQDIVFELSLIDALYNHEQLQQQVITDALTQIGNRQALTQLNMKLQNQSHLSVAMLDIDYFKKYNDYYGHLAGDELLHQFGKLLMKHFPNSHLIRYGGEEFTIIDTVLQESNFIKALMQFQSALTSLA